MDSCRAFAVAVFLASFFVGVPQVALAEPATAITTDLNRSVLDALPFSDRKEFEEASRGLLLRPDTLVIRAADGRVVWDLDSYRSFITMDSPAPDTVNPSLWRNAQLNLEYGLYEVTDGIYQVRGYDLANITFIRGDSGWIVYDVGSSMETARSAYDLVTQKFGERPITAVLYSHSHHDHYSGVKGLIDESDALDGSVAVIAPEGFLEHAVSEGVIAGNAMTRRATYMYGALLPKGPEGSVGAGLGLTTPRGTSTLIAPNTYISNDAETMTVDGIEMEFQLTPGTEAPAEMNTYFPQFKALWMAENTVSTMHNILTLRGAPVRDALAWARYINETIDRYGDQAEVKFQSHHWPKWGNADIVDYLKKQRDLYKFIHDRSVYLMNQGYTGEEISEIIKLPESLENFWPGRGYYGTLRHNARAVYQRYMGWYTGNPSDLNNLPPVESARKYVEYMGGEVRVLERARADFDEGEYRWTASVLKHVVFANPENSEAKDLLAKSYEQLGYQAESGPWRSIYLQGAYELRNGAPNLSLKGGSVSPDIVNAMTPEMLFDYLAVRINAERTEGEIISVNLHLSDIDKSYNLTIENSVLNYSSSLPDDAEATATLTKATLDRINAGETSLAEELQSGAIEVAGDAGAFERMLGMLDDHASFNIVTP